VDDPVLPIHAVTRTPLGKPSMDFYEKFLDQLFDGLYFVDRERRITYWNQGAEQLTGYSASEVVGSHCFDNLLRHVDDEGCALCLHGCPLELTIADGQRRETELYLRHKLGHRVPVSARVAPIRNDEGKILGALEIFSDVSEKKKAERRAIELEQLAFRDELTGIPNRRYMELKVQQAIQEVEEFDRSIGLLMIDLDHFKRVNDIYGHQMGDATLRVISRTIAGNLRLGDIAGRWGGEELLVIGMDVSAADLLPFAEKLRNLISESTIADASGRITVTASIGATIIKRGDSAGSAIQRADELMYRSKVSGRNSSTIG
jgi:diguanylate cyclase (GGDEF)-like protein/PAS domain S-box-containing protein